MALADLSLPSRLMAGGGPSSPDPRVFRALSAPLIGQFDPHFTAIMDQTMALARAVFITANPRCFPVSGLATAGLEALLNTLLEERAHVAIGGGPAFSAETTDMAHRLGAQVHPLEGLGPSTELVVVPLVDPTSGRISPIKNLARRAHAFGARLLVDATFGLGACELRIDEWQVDACSAGVQCALGAPAGMALVTYNPAVEARLHARRSPPRTSYLDLLQLQAYWSPDRLNHHTAPTSLVYGLRETLRLIDDEGLIERWARHRQIGDRLRAGLAALGLQVEGDSPLAVVRLPPEVDAAAARHALREQFGIHVALVAERTWRIGLLGADARPDTVRRVLGALQHVLAENGAA